MNTSYERLAALYDLSDTVLKRPELVYFTVQEKQLPDCLNYLKTHEGFRHLVMISAVDWLEEGVFQLTYHLHNYADKVDFGVRCFVSREEATAPGAHHLWPTAQVYQREIREMFGIDFPGSPDVNEPMILEGWDEMPPMRRDFDTREYSDKTYFPREGRFTEDPQTKMEERYPIEAKVKHGVEEQL
jgi:NADH-quinone oxidoreductase subunit C